MLYMRVVSATVPSISSVAVQEVAVWVAYCAVHGPVGFDWGMLSRNRRLIAECAGLRSWDTRPDAIYAVASTAIL